jgi:hypothetical protein
VVGGGENAMLVGVLEIGLRDRGMQPVPVPVPPGAWSWPSGSWLMGCAKRHHCASVTEEEVCLLDRGMQPEPVPPGT